MNNSTIISSKPEKEDPIHENSNEHNSEDEKKEDVKPSNYEDSGKLTSKTSEKKVETLPKEKKKACCINGFFILNLKVHLLTIF